MKFSRQKEKDVQDFAKILEIAHLPLIRTTTLFSRDPIRVSRLGFSSHVQPQLRYQGRTSHKIRQIKVNQVDGILKYMQCPS